MVYSPLVLLLQLAHLRLGACKKADLLLIQLSKVHKSPSPPWYHFPEEDFYWGKYDNLTKKKTIGNCTPSCGHPVISYNYEASAGWEQDFPPLGNPMCGLGGRQSPIDIKTDGVVSLAHGFISFGYEPVMHASVINNGHYLAVDSDFGFLHSKTQGSSTYKAVNYHIHAPSEHRIDGKVYPMELHIVHKRDTAESVDEHYYQGSAVGILLDIGNETNPCIQKLLNPIPSVSCSACIGNVNLNACFHEQFEGPYYNYDGSVTTPPCNERMEWFLMARTASISQADFEKFRLLAYGEPGDSRPVQPLNGRPVFMFNP